MHIKKTFKEFFCCSDEKTNINFFLSFVDTDSQSDYVTRRIICISYFAEWSLFEDSGQVHNAPVVVGGAAAFVQHLVISRLEQTVPDVIPGASSSSSCETPLSWPVHAIGKVFEHDLSVRVAAPLLWGEPRLGRLGGCVQGGRHGDLTECFRAIQKTKPV